MKNNLKRMINFLEELTLGFVGLLFIEVTYVCICAVFVMLFWNFILIPLNIFSEKISYQQSFVLLLFARYFWRILSKRFLVKHIRK